MNDEAAAVHWTVYMLECADKTLYTGITNDLDRRMAEHEAGKGARYTKGRGPFRLVYQESCAGRAEGRSTVNRGHEHQRSIRRCNTREGRPRRFGGAQRGSGT